MELDLLTPPSWSSKWCYFYFATTLIGAAVVLAVLAMNVSKIGMVGVVAGFLGLAINFLHGMTYFWMCRASLSQYE